MPAVLLGSNDIKENPKPPAPVEDDSVHTHTTAFIVLVNKDGTYSLETDINKPVIPERKPNGTEIKAALQTIMLDVQIQETAVLAAQATLSMQEQKVRAMMEAQQNAQMLQKLGQK